MFGQQNPIVVICVNSIQLAATSFNTGGKDVVTQITTHSKTAPMSVNRMQSETSILYILVKPTGNICDNRGDNSHNKRFIIGSQNNLLPLSATLKQRRSAVKPCTCTNK